MIKNKIIFTIFSALLATTSMTTQAIIIADSDSDLGIQVGTRTYANCPSYCSGDSEWSTSFTNDSSAYTEEDTYGLAKAYGDFSGDSYLPNLKLYAESVAGKGAGASANAVQGFNYLGTDTSDFTLNFNLHGSASGDASLSTSIAILIGDDADTEYWHHIPTNYYEVNYGDTRGGVASAYLSNVLDGNDSNSITFSIAAGQSFYVLTEMHANAKGGIADAMNTLTMNFEDNTGLQAVYGVTNTVSVPEPSTIMLFFIALTLVVRRKV